ncbi:hypothetical protein BX600DRAFT_537225 [Xylariales sp. PMI_506]|nr:hypothetical protein BX600DRAFT_537225 [Xylariales sp. PMI_506]
MNMKCYFKVAFPILILLLLSLPLGSRGLVPPAHGDNSAQARHNENLEVRMPTASCFHKSACYASNSRELNIRTESHQPDKKQYTKTTLELNEALASALQLYDGLRNMSNGFAVQINSIGGFITSIQEVLRASGTITTATSSVASYSTLTVGVRVQTRPSSIPDAGIGAVGSSGYLGYTNVLEASSPPIPSQVLSTNIPQSGSMAVSTSQSSSQALVVRPITTTRSPSSTPPVESSTWETISQSSTYSTLAVPVVAGLSTVIVWSPTGRVGETTAVSRSAEVSLSQGLAPTYVTRTRFLTSTSTITVRILGTRLAKHTSKRQSPSTDTERANITMAMPMTMPMPTRTTKHSKIYTGNPGSSIQSISGNSIGSTSPPPEFSASWRGLLGAREHLSPSTSGFESSSKQTPSCGSSIQTPPDRPYQRKRGQERQCQP